MTGKLPIIDQLTRFRADADRAAWLRQCPDSVVAEHYEDIRKAIVASGFTAGLAFLWARLAMVQAVRQADGRHPVSVEHGLVAADIVMGLRA